MTRFCCAVLGCVAAAAMPLGAQGQTDKPAPAASSTITVVGCLENAVADGSLGGTPLGTSATPADAGIVANVQPTVDGFLLTGAKPAGAPSAVGTTGSAASTAGAAKDELKTYALDGNRAELAAHKGHRVEITGTLAPPVPAGNRPADQAFQTGVQQLRVQTLKMTAATCQEK